MAKRRFLGGLNAWFLAISATRPRISAFRRSCREPPALISQSKKASSRKRPPKESCLPVTGHDSLKTRRTLTIAGKSYDYFSLEAAAQAAGLGDISRLPFSMKVLLESHPPRQRPHRPGRRYQGRRRMAEDAQLRARDRLPPRARADAGFYRRARRRRSGRDARCDGAARRRSEKDQSAGAGRSSDRPFGAGRQLRHAHNFRGNFNVEFERNRERYTFLRWGQEAFNNFRVVPPGTGICHQVNLEYLAKVVWTTEEGGKTIAFPIRWLAPIATRR